MRDQDGSSYIELNDFSIYRVRGKKRGLELCTLDRLQVEAGVDELCFSGYLSAADLSFHVYNISFSILAIDGYGDGNSTDVDDKISIQSPRAKGHGLWYRLGKPADEYKAFHQPFIWLATFTKFFVEFLLEEEDVTLRRFRSMFPSFLRQQYGPAMQSWHQECGFQTDFGTSVVAYVNYLYKECYSIDSDDLKLLRHPIWQEINPLALEAIPFQSSSGPDATTVTPFVYDCFRDAYFASHLTEQEPLPEMQAKITERKYELGLTPWYTAHVERPSLVEHIEQHRPLKVHRGDVVCIKPDADGFWKESSSTMWYAYVQVVRRDLESRTKLDVLWLYESSHTTIGDSYYPYENELFLSDNCSCGKEAIPIEDVTAVVDVSWFVSNPKAVSGYFVRQKFKTVEEEDSYAFLTLRSEDFTCQDHHLTEFEACCKKYHVGQHVLVSPEFEIGADSFLQPMRILDFNLDQEKVILRRFMRTSDEDSDAPPNELRVLDDEYILPASRILRHCKVAHFPSRDQVKSPFNCNGAGDCFYILENGPLSSQSSLPTPPYSNDDDLRTSPSPGTKPLPALDLFCGGGNFGRGLEDAGIAQVCYAVDWDAPALHSHRANVAEPEKVQYFLGSVSEYLHRALKGSEDVRIAKLGEIECALAGSPCPGFSAMQQNKQSWQSLRNASMVASVVSFVDFYSPQYFILENVVPMTNNLIVDDRKQNVFSQILAALVALGYQVQQFLEDAWSQGSSQQRSRVFIVASAPGIEPVHPSYSTHGHPPGKEIQRKLGKTSNGLPFGIRRFDPAPFPFVSAKQSTKDLPDIGDSLPQICPRFPDHRTASDQSLATRQRLSRVPLRPHGMGLAQAVHSGTIASGEAHRWLHSSNPVRAHPRSKSYSRVDPDRLFPTVMTKFELQCGFNGRCVHWEQHRSLSIMEARRAQGFLDHEVLVGSPAQQLKIVGNSVDRKVAFAKGLALRESWEATVRRRGEVLGEVDGVSAAEGELASETDRSVEDEPFTTTTPHPSPEQIAKIKWVDGQARPRNFKAMLEKFRAKSEESRSRASTWVIQDEGCRWSGDYPADAVVVRRMMAELESVLRARDENGSDEKFAPETQVAE